MQLDRRISSIAQVHLTFRLDVVDGWPPVAAEGIPCFHDGGAYRIRVPPLFVKGLSAGDVIEVLDEDQDFATLVAMASSAVVEQRLVSLESA